MRYPCTLIVLGVAQQHAAQRLSARHRGVSGAVATDTPTHWPNFVLNNVWSCPSIEYLSLIVTGRAFMRTRASQSPVCCGSPSFLTPWLKREHTTKFSEKRSHGKETKKTEHITLCQRMRFVPAVMQAHYYRGTSLIRNSTPLGPYSRTMLRLAWWC